MAYSNSQALRPYRMWLCSVQHKPTITQRIDRLRMHAQVAATSGSPSKAMSAFFTPWLNAAQQHGANPLPKGIIPLWHEFCVLNAAWRRVLRDRPPNPPWCAAEHYSKLLFHPVHTRAGPKAEGVIPWRQTTKRAQPAHQVRPEQHRAARADQAVTNHTR